MTTRTLTRDEQVNIARKYQLALTKLMFKLEEDLAEGVFADREIRGAMLALKLCVLDAAHDAALHTLTTTEEEESISALEKGAAEYELVAQSRVKIWVMKRTCSLKA